MPLQPGTTLGSYAVTAFARLSPRRANKIGEGGRGEVYRARRRSWTGVWALKH